VILVYFYVVITNMLQKLFHLPPFSLKDCICDVKGVRTCATAHEYPASLQL